MRRWDVLRSAALVTAASVGLAGCSGSDADESDRNDDEDGTESGGEAICQAPEDPLEESFPNSERFEQEQIFTDLADYFDESVERVMTARYSGPNDETYSFGIFEYADRDAATEMASETAEFESEGKAASGYIVVERYSYFGAGPDEGSVTDFMATSPALNEWCVKNNVEFV